MKVSFSLMTDAVRHSLSVSEMITTFGWLLVVTRCQHVPSLNRLPMVLLPQVTTAGICRTPCPAWGLHWRESPWLPSWVPDTWSTWNLVAHTWPASPSSWSIPSWSWRRSWERFWLLQKAGTAWGCRKIYGLPPRGLGCHRSLPHWKASWHQHRHCRWLFGCQAAHYCEAISLGYPRPLSYQPSLTPKCDSGEMKRFSVVPVAEFLSIASAGRSIGSFLWAQRRNI